MNVEKLLKRLKMRAQVRSIVKRARKRHPHDGEARRAAVEAAINAYFYGRQAYTESYETYWLAEEERRRALERYL